MYMTDLDHSSTGFYTILIVLTVSSKPTMPGVRPLNHPAFLQGRKAWRAGWPCLHFDMPVWTMCRHPGVQSAIVILLIRKDRDETRKVVWMDVPEQERCCYPIIKTRTGNEHGQQQAQGIDQQMPLAAIDFLATIIPALGASHLRRLDRLAIDAHRTRGGFTPRCHAGAFAQGFDYLGPGSIGTPLGKVVIDGTLGQQIVWQHIPLAATTVQVKQRIQDFPHVDLPRAPSSGGLFGGWDQRSHDSPLRVRQLRGIFSPRLIFVYHVCALLY